MPAKTLFILFVIAVLVPGWRLPAETGEPAGKTQPEADRTDEESRRLPRQLFSGKVVLLGEALRRRNIPATEEVDNQAVLETPDGQLIPIVPDWRGRSLFQDERLRNREVELVGIRPPGVPYLQVLSIYTFDENGVRQYTDYWCDICAIPMYEIKPCNCCQGPIRLRFQPRDLPDYLTPRKPN